MSNDIEGFLQNYPPNVQELARLTQAWVKQVLPESSEELALGYKMIMYKLRPNGRQFVVYIAPYPKHVNLGFLMGTSLSDPHKVLKGTGKTLRHIKIKQAGDLEKVGVRAVVEAAWEEAVIRNEP
jgi:hypothetical protein